MDDMLADILATFTFNRDFKLALADGEPLPVTEGSPVYMRGRLIRWRGYDVYEADINYALLRRKWPWAVDQYGARPMNRFEPDFYKKTAHELAEEQARDTFILAAGREGVYRSRDFPCGRIATRVTHHFVFFHETDGWIQGYKKGSEEPGFRFALSDVSFLLRRGHWPWQPEPALPSPEAGEVAETEAYQEKRRLARRAAQYEWD